MQSELCLVHIVVVEGGVGALLLPNHLVDVLEPHLRRSQVFLIYGKSGESLKQSHRARGRPSRSSSPTAAVSAPA